MNLSFKHYYWRWIKNQLLLFVVMLLLLSLARLGFSFAFGDWSELMIQKEEFKKALFLGLRYDLMPLAYINLLPFLLMQIGYLIPGKFTIKSLRFSVISLLLIGYVLLGWLYVFDYAFYSYFQDHLNILFFGFFEDDTVALLTSIWKNYNLPLWLTVFAVAHYTFYKVLTFLFSPFDFNLKVRKFDYRVIASALVGLTLLAFLGRGNFTRLPLSLEDSHISTNEFINEVSLNGVLTFNRAMKIRKEFGTKDVNYLKRFGFDTWQSAFQVVFPDKKIEGTLTESLKTKSPLNAEAKARPPHVVLVVMESFGSYWNDQHSASFNILGSLEDHFKKGILYKNFLSAENGTIGSIVSVATSQPIRQGARFLSESDFMKTHLKTSGHLPYKKAGYETHFIYGGKLGWRDLGKFLAIQRYDHLWGADEIKEAMPELNNIEPKDLGNEWGIFDEYLYTFVEEQIRTSNKPQFFLVMTTSNHPPFEYPSSYNTLPLDLNKEVLAKVTVSEEIARKRFLGLQYANQKIGEFLTRIKTTALNDNVVLALTGDHSYWIAKGVGLDQEFRRYAVPFFISLPERLTPSDVDTENYGSHEDIFPTLYHLTLSEQEYYKIGEDLLSEEGIAMNSSSLMASRDGAYHHKTFWKWAEGQGQLLMESAPTSDMEKMLKRGQGIVGLTDFYLKEEKSRRPSDGGNGQQ